MDKLSFILRHPNYGHVLPICVLADQFVPSASQRTTLKRNEDTLCRVFKRFSDHPVPQDHETIARKWLVERHGHDPRDYRAFPDTLGFIAIDHAHTGQALAGMLFKEHANEMEARFLYYDTDPAHKRRSLGTLAILRLIELAQMHGHAQVNLGLWSPNKGKRLAYKTNFKPCRIWTGNGWKDYTPLPHSHDLMP